MKEGLYRNIKDVASAAQATLFLKSAESLLNSQWGYQVNYIQSVTWSKCSEAIPLGVSVGLRSHTATLSVLLANLTVDLPVDIFE
jgi:hypothetical protein